MLASILYIVRQSTMVTKGYNKVKIYRSQGPFFKKKSFLKLVRQFVVEFVMQLFLHDSDMPFPNLAHAKL